MIQGTMSNSGKTFVTAGLCRVFKQDGYKVAPFKSQNMALNSYITKEGLEIGRAQAMQAEAAMIEPTHWMNPILLKPTSSMGSQVIVNGEVYDNLSAQEYYKMKDNLAPEVMKAFNHLSEENDIIVIEGAGSPAEINLAENDIVNMGMAKWQMRRLFLLQILTEEAYLLPHMERLSYFLWKIRSVFVELSSINSGVMWIS